MKTKLRVWNKDEHQVHSPAHVCLGYSLISPAEHYFDRLINKPPKNNQNVWNMTLNLAFRKQNVLYNTLPHAKYELLDCFDSSVRIFQ